LQLPVLTAIFKAFCTDRKDIGDLDVLGDIAQETGVMPKEEVR
jgi:predicted DsbA family dithiol-disulfide isomerase